MLRDAEVTVVGERPLPLAVEQPLFRVAQEALANVARHSHAANVILHLEWQANMLTMTIQDNGAGFDTTTTAYGMGLSSMEERLARLNGRFSITSSLGQGTKLTAVVPLT